MFSRAILSDKKLLTGPTLIMNILLRDYEFRNGLHVCSIFGIYTSMCVTKWHANCAAVPIPCNWKNEKMKRFQKVLYTYVAREAARTVRNMHLLTGRTI